MLLISQFIFFHSQISQRCIYYGKKIYQVAILFNFEVCRNQVDSSRIEAEKDGVVVPETLEEYCVKTIAKPNDEIEVFDLDEDYYDYGDESGIC